MSYILSGTGISRMFSIDDGHDHLCATIYLLEHLTSPLNDLHYEISTTMQAW